MRRTLPKSNFRASVVDSDTFELLHANNQHGPGLPARASTHHSRQHCLFSAHHFQILAYHSTHSYRYWPPTHHPPSRTTPHRGATFSEKSYFNCVLSSAEHPFVSRDTAMPWSKSAGYRPSRSGSPKEASTASNPADTARVSIFMSGLPSTRDRGSPRAVAQPFPGIFQQQICLSLSDSSAHPVAICPPLSLRVQSCPWPGIRVWQDARPRLLASQIRPEFQDQDLAAPFLQH